MFHSDRQLVFLWQLIYFFSALGPRDIISIVEGAGFEASIFKRDLQGAGDYLSQREEIKKWRNSFFVSCQCFRFWAIFIFGLL